MPWTTQMCQLCTVRSYEECCGINFGIGGEHDGL